VDVFDLSHNALHFIISLHRLGVQAARARSGQVRSATYAPKTAKSIWSRGMPTQSPAHESAESPSKSRRGRKEDDYDMKDAFDGDIDPSGRTILGVLSSSSSSSGGLSSSALSSSSSASAFSSSAFPFYPSYPSYPSYSYSYSGSRSFPLMHSAPDSNSPSNSYSPLPSDSISEDSSYSGGVGMFNDFKDYRGRPYTASSHGQDDAAPLLDDKRSYYERYESEQGGQGGEGLSDYSREFSRGAEYRNKPDGPVHEYFYSSYPSFYPLAASGSGLSQATTLSSRSRTPTSDASNASSGSQSSQGGLSESPPPETARDSLLRQLEAAEDDVEIDTLALLFDPPIQGCELQPYVSVRQNCELKALQSQSLEAAKSGGLLPSETSSFPEGKAEFRWFRGPKRICSVSSCGSVASVQCLSCLRCGLSPNMAYFCSQKCLKESWPQHRHLHSLHSAPSSPWDEDDNEDDLFEKGADAPERIRSKFPPPSPPEWVLVSRQRIYVPTAEDVGCCLRLECNPLNKNDSSSTKILYTMPVSTSPPAPIPRQTIYKVPPPSGLAGRGFKVLNYNILAQIYATQQAYPYASLWSLQWSYRKTILLREILNHNADIICLQEVQANHFEKFFHPELYKAGYDGVLKRKNRPAVGDDPGAIDGCATFYKRDRFALCEQYGIGFNDAARRDYPEGKSLQRLLKGNVALVIVLEDVGQARAPGRRQQKRRLLCVANTHICANPELTEVKLWQTWVLVKELEKLVLHRDLPLLLCGDFNSLLDSVVYEFLSSERVESGNEVFKQDPFKILPDTSALQHGLPLSSAYGAYGEPKFTNYTGHFLGVLDYIWHSKPHLYPTSCLVIEEEPQLKKEVALPNAQFPSDHLPLVSEFDWFAEA